jgi:RNA polymerase sigma factor (sigma-70 family)
LATISKVKNINKHGHIENELLQQCCKNDQRAIKSLYEFCFHYLMPLCARYHVNNEDARASLNQGFLKIINGLPQVVNDELNFAAWSKRVMNNCLIDEYRSTKKQKQVEINKETEREVEINGNSYYNDGEIEMDYNALLQIVRKLNPSTHRVFCLYAIDGYSHKEIAELLEMPEGTSKWHLANARKQLKELLEKQELELNTNKIAL